jgi:hypothetical protein
MIKISQKKYSSLIKKYHYCDGIKNNFGRGLTVLFPILYKAIPNNRCTYLR